LPGIPFSPLIIEKGIQGYEADKHLFNNNNEAACSDNTCKYILSFVSITTSSQTLLFMKAEGLVGDKFLIVILSVFYQK